MKGSYQLKSFTEDQNAEVLRLKAQVELFFSKEFETYQKLGLKDGMDIIECGSGPGYLMLNITRNLPNCNAYALEIDPFLFEVLQSNSIQEGKQVYKPMQGSIYEIDLPDNCVDFVVTRLVIEHLQEPMDAFKELRRILRPDGILVIVSNDFDYHVITFPPVPELNDMFDAYNRSRFSEGGNPVIGRQLPLYLNKIGFSNIDINTIVAHSTKVGDKAMLEAENVNISRSLVKEGFLNPDTLESMLQGWYNMLNHPEHVIMRQLFIISGTKDTGASPDFTPLTKHGDLETKKPDFQEGQQKISGNTEDELLLLWKELIGKDEITTTDNFFEVGGDSVLIPEIVNRLKSDFGKLAKIMDFFQYPTVQSLAKQIDSQTSENDPIAQESNTAKAKSIPKKNVDITKIKSQRDKFKKFRK